MVLIQNFFFVCRLPPEVVSMLDLQSKETLLR
jgi:hypothetical protein